jgi:hypothetical protein
MQTGTTNETGLSHSRLQRGGGRMGRELLQFLWDNYRTVASLALCPTGTIPVLISQEIISLRNKLRVHEIIERHA